MQEKIKAILFEGRDFPNVHVLANDCRPILQLGMVTFLVNWLILAINAML